MIRVSPILATSGIRGWRACSTPTATALPTWRAVRLGWGCERVIEHQLTEFDLRDTIAHNQGAYNAIIADTIARNESGENVLYYTWTPYWVSGVLIPGDNVEWLEVPYSSLPDGATANTVYEGKDLGFAVDSIRVVATDSFLKRNPAARILFEVATIDINDISAQNKLVADGEDDSDDIDRHVDDWISDKQAAVQQLAESRPRRSGVGPGFLPTAAGRGLSPPRSLLAKVLQSLAKVSAHVLID